LYVICFFQELENAIRKQDQTVEGLNEQISRLTKDLKDTRVRYCLVRDKHILPIYTLLFKGKDFKYNKYNMSSTCISRRLIISVNIF